MTFKKILGFLAMAGLLFIAAPSKPAHAVSLLNPAAAALVQQTGETAATEVRFRRRGYGYRRSFYRPRYYAPRRFYGRRYYAPRRFYGGRRFYGRY
jgi:hypothetical protein